MTRVQDDPRHVHIRRRRDTRRELHPHGQRETGATLVGRAQAVAGEIAHVDPGVGRAEQRVEAEVAAAGNSGGVGAGDLQRLDIVQWPVDGREVVVWMYARVGNYMETKFTKIYSLVVRRT